MGSEVHIRAYQTRDLAACRDLWRELTERHREIYADASIGGDDPGRHFDVYCQRADLAGSWVAEIEGRVAGMVGLLIDGDRAEIEPVVVRMPLRGCAIGTQLLRHVTAEAQRRGLRHLSIRPVARNASAMACFHRAGFRLLGHIEMFRVLDGADEARWRPGVNMHGLDFRH